MFAAVRLLVRLPVALVWWAVACTCQPDSLPTDAELSVECGDCLTVVSDADTGCGAEESACSADEACESAMLCILTFDCLETDDPDACAARHDCNTAQGASAELLGAFEACARTNCAGPCQFQ